MKIKVKFLERFYNILLIIVFLVIIITPSLINDQVSLTRNLIIREEYAESFLIIILLVLAYLVFYLYTKEHKKNLRRLVLVNKDKKELEARLNDAFKYIGSVNVQVQEIRDVFTKLKKYPEDKKEFRDILNFLAQKALGIVNADWVMLRIINTENHQILREYVETRGKSVLLKSQIEVSDLLNNCKIDNCTVISTEPKELSFKVFCIFPAVKLSDNQMVLIKALLTELEMLFLIFTSSYLKKKS